MLEGMLLGQSALVTFTVEVERLVVMPCSTSAGFTLAFASDELDDEVDVAGLGLVELPHPTSASAPTSRKPATIVRRRHDSLIRRHSQKSAPPTTVGAGVSWECSPPACSIASGGPHASYDGHIPPAFRRGRRSAGVSDRSSCRSRRSARGAVVRPRPG